MALRSIDLMIGDWVKSRGKIERVTSVYEGFICTDSFEDSHDYYFDPIPLTTDILEKNSQELIPGINLMYQLKGPYCASNEDGQWVFGLVKVDGENSARYPLVKISFVHELQHALRLCGIDKEIII